MPPEIPTRIKNPEPSEEKRIVHVLLDGLEQSGFAEDFRGPIAEARKERLKTIAKQLPTIGRLLLAKFRVLVQAQGLSVGDIALFVVGGRALNTPIKDNTDFDIVISSEQRLSPLPKHSDITYPQRHAIARALYAEIEPIFVSLGIGDTYEKGIIEFKAFGDRTAEESEKGEGVLKIVESKT